MVHFLIGGQFQLSFWSKKKKRVLHTFEYIDSSSMKRYRSSRVASCSKRARTMNNFSHQHVRDPPMVEQVAHRMTVDSTTAATLIIGDEQERVLRQLLDRIRIRKPTLRVVRSSHDNPVNDQLRNLGNVVLIVDDDFDNVNQEKSERVNIQHRVGLVIYRKRRILHLDDFKNMSRLRLWKKRFRYFSNLFRKIGVQVPLVELFERRQLLTDDNNLLCNEDHVTPKVFHLSPQEESLFNDVSAEIQDRYSNLTTIFELLHHAFLIKRIILDIKRKTVANTLILFDPLNWTVLNSLKHSHGICSIARNIIFSELNLLFFEQNFSSLEKQKFPPFFIDQVYSEFGSRRVFEFSGRDIKAHGATVTQLRHCNRFTDSVFLADLNILHHFTTAELKENKDLRIIFIPSCSKMKALSTKFFFREGFECERFVFDEIDLTFPMNFGDFEFLHLNQRIDLRHVFYDWYHEHGEENMQKLLNSDRISFRQFVSDELKNDKKEHKLQSPLSMPPLLPQSLTADCDFGKILFEKTTLPQDLILEILSYIQAPYGKYIYPNQKNWSQVSIYLQEQIVGKRETTVKFHKMLEYEAKKLLEQKKNQVVMQRYQMTRFGRIYIYSCPEPGKMLITGECIFSLIMRSQCEWGFPYWIDSTRKFGYLIPTLKLRKLLSL